MHSHMYLPFQVTTTLITSFAKAREAYYFQGRAGDRLNKQLTHELDRETKLHVRIAGYIDASYTYIYAALLRWNLVPRYFVCTIRAMGILEAGGFCTRWNSRLKLVWGTCTACLGYRVPRSCSTRWIRLLRIE